MGNYTRLGAAPRVGVVARGGSVRPPRRLFDRARGGPVCFRAGVGRARALASPLGEGSLSPSRQRRAGGCQAPRAPKKRGSGSGGGWETRDTKRSYLWGAPRRDSLWERGGRPAPSRGGEGRLRVSADGDRPTPACTADPHTSRRSGRLGARRGTRGEGPQPASGGATSAPLAKDASQDSMGAKGVKRQVSVQVFPRLLPTTPARAERKTWGVFPKATSDHRRLSSSSSHNNSKV